MDIPTVIVDPEFQDLIPVLSQEEKDGLEKSIKEEGCRDALILWDGILIDGHRRYEICQRNNIEFKAVSRTFDNRDQAKIWIICNQLARRNITPNQRRDLIGVQYKLEKKTFSEAGAMKGKSLDQNDPGSSTAEKIAEQHHVGPATVRRAEKFHDKLEKLSPEERAEILAGKSGKTKAEIISPPSTDPNDEEIESFESNEKPAKQESDDLWKLKQIWKRATKKDRKAFLRWIKKEGDES
jgi:ParB-like chromosome segregation protein Spo0J